MREVSYVSISCCHSHEINFVHERKMAAARVRGTACVRTHLPIAYAAWFRTGHSLVVRHGLVVGDPDLGYNVV